MIPLRLLHSLPRLLDLTDAFHQPVSCSGDPASLFGFHRFHLRLLAAHPPP